MASVCTCVNHGACVQQDEEEKVCRSSALRSASSAGMVVASVCAWPTTAEANASSAATGPAVAAASAIEAAVLAAEDAPDASVLSTDAPLSACALGHEGR